MSFINWMSDPRDLLPWFHSLRSYEYALISQRNILSATALPYFMGIRLMKKADIMTNYSPFLSMWHIRMISKIVPWN
jgi:hypothetical protein